MCDGTLCPCNLVEPTPAELVGRRKRRAARGRGFLWLAVYLCAAVIVTACVRVATGVAVLDVVGAALIVAVFLAVVVGVLMVAPAVLARIGARHRAAVEHARRQP